MSPISQTALFISCKESVDPIAMIEKHVRDVERSGVTHTRYVKRFEPMVLLNNLVGIASPIA